MSWVDTYPPVPAIEPGPRAGALLLVVAGDEDEGFVRPEWVAGYLDCQLVGARFLSSTLNVVHQGGAGVSSYARQWCDLNGVEQAAVPIPQNAFGTMAQQQADRELLQVGLRAKAAGWGVRGVVFPVRGRRLGWGMLTLLRTQGIPCDVEIENDTAKGAA